MKIHIDDKMTFTNALKNENIENIRKFPKADLHNHFVLGGNKEYIFKKTGYVGSYRFKGCNHY